MEPNSKIFRGNQLKLKQQQITQISSKKVQIELQRECLYTTVFGQCFSPCRKYLAACSSFGKISIFSLQTALSPEATADSWKPWFTFRAHDGGSIYTLLTNDNLLISAGTGSVHAWSWTELFNRNAKVLWTLDIPMVDKTANPEINALAIDNQDGDSHLYAGCGDNQVHVWDIANGSHMMSLRGHTDYIHCLALQSTGRYCLTGSEDGTVRLWDTRTSGREAVHILEPQKNEACARPHVGKWIGCIAVDKADDWMVCGGGPALALWHLRTMSITAVFDAENVSMNHAQFYDDRIISAGTSPHVYHWSVNGEMRAKIPCSPTNVFSVAINESSESNKVLCVAGNSHKIDVCTNFNYKAFSLTFL